MVKRQKEKQYQSAREHRSNQSLRSGSAGAGATTSSGYTRPLPFHCCALTLTPYTSPACTPNGVVFETSAIMPYLMSHGSIDPVTGEKMATRDLISLNMDRDEETGRWQCPVLGKPFTDRTKVVAIRQNPPGNEANVYSYEAVHELNIKAKNYEDLTSGKKFHRTRDVIVLQDPDDEELGRLRDINNFKHLIEKRAKEQQSSTRGDVRHSVTASRIMDKIKRKREEEEGAAEKRKKAASSKESADGKSSDGPKIYTNDLMGSSLTSGRASSSLTSTAMGISNANDIREATSEEILQSRFRAMRKLKKKGFVRLVTTHGDIDLEVHADIAPRTATNFLGLCESGKYDGSPFHRSIRNFMIQGGKPSDKAEAEQSLWGGPFPDEFDDRLSHSGPGVLSSANAGPGTNRRQFFLTFKSCAHLDRKHSVFGRVVKGMDVLKAMEAVPTDKNDRPKQEIKIVRAEVMANPAAEAEEAERVRVQEAAEARRREKEERRASALGRDVRTRPSASSSGRGVGGGAVAGSKKAEGGAQEKKPAGVGKYLPKGSLRSLDEMVGAPGADAPVAKRSSKGIGSSVATAKAAKAPSRLPPPPKKTTFGDFSGW